MSERSLKSTVFHLDQDSDELKQNKFPTYILKRTPNFQVTGTENNCIIWKQEVAAEYLIKYEYRLILKKLIKKIMLLLFY